MTLRCWKLFVAAVSLAAACTDSTRPAAGDSLLVDCRCSSISPQDANLFPGDTLQLTIALRPGETKFWSSSDSTRVAVSQYGLAVARKPGSAVISARSNLSGVPAETAYVRVSTFEPPPPLEAFITAAEEVATGKPVDLSAASGDIDFHVIAYINDPSFLRSLSLVTSRVGGADTTVVATVATPTTAGEFDPTFRWSTGAKTASGAAVFPNGTYVVRVVGTFVSGVSVRAFQTQIVVANP